MKYENVISLQNDLNKMIEKHSTLVDKNDFGSALNIMKNIDILTEQLKKIDYETMVSKYTLVKDNDKEINKKVISIWKQNAFGDIKDHEIYYLGEKYENNIYDFLNDLSKSWSTMSDEMKESVYQLVGAKNKPVVKEIIKDYDRDNKWYDILKFFIDSNQSQLIELDYSNKTEEVKHHGTGKTTALIRLANEYNLPVITDKIHFNLLKDIEKSLNLTVNIVNDLSILAMPQYKNINTVLIDENTNSRFINSKYTIIGFKNNIK